MATTQQPTYYYGTGGRKTATARVRLYPGRGEVIINGRPLAEYFPRLASQMMVMEPLRVTNTADKMTVVVKVEGGGNSGQAGAVRHGIARALVVFDSNLRPVLRRYGSPYSLLSRDPRARERQKVGLKRARKAPQYTKR